MAPPIPNIFPWFILPNSVFFFLFAIITGVTAFIAYRLFKLTENRGLKLFSISFLLFTLSYVFQFILHLVISNKLQESMHMRHMGKAIMPLRILSTYSEVIFFTIGLALLTYMILKIKNKKVLSLLLLLPIIGIFYSFNMLNTYHVISTLFLGFIAHYYFKNYINHKQKSTLFVFLAFMLLMFGHMNFIFEIHGAIFNLIGNFLALIAYICILASLIIISRRK